MAVNTSAVRVIAHGGAVSEAVAPSKVFHYATNDTHATMAGSNYFDLLYSMLNAKVGDFILASGDLDGTPTGRLYMISAISAGAVTVVQIANT